MTNKQFAWSLAKQALLGVRDAMCTVGVVVVVLEVLRRVLE